MKKILFLLIAFFFTGCTNEKFCRINHHGVVAPDINSNLLGKNRAYIIDKLGNAGIPSESKKNCMYYIGNSTKNLYFQRPTNTGYTIKEICFSGDNVISATDLSNNASKKLVKYSKNLSYEKKTMAEIGKTLLESVNLSLGK